MSNIVLVAETGCDIPPALAEQHGIHLVPMHVSFGNVTLDDGSFPVEQVCEYYTQTGYLPKTSGCSPADFEKIFDEIHSLWPEKHILHLAYSSITTCSYQSALVAAVERDYVTSIDTRNVSVGQAAVVLEMAKIIEQSPWLPPQDAAQLAAEVSDHVRMCFIPSELEYLRAGGRISNVVALGGRLLQLRPCIEIKNGALVAAKKYRGSLQRTVSHLIREYTAAQNLDKDQIYFLWSTGLPEDIRTLAEAEARACGFQTVTWMKTGGVITTHGGPGAFGIAGFIENGIDGV